MQDQFDDAGGVPMIDKIAYRQAMSRLGAAVSVVTSAGSAGISGATISAVCSVTDDPPTLLVCVNQQARSNRIIRENRVLCVNVLADSQRPVADIFSGSAGIVADERFAHVEHGVLSTGAPVLESAIVSFDCELIQAIEIGTHSIFLARVVDVGGNEAAGCLIYFGRKYLGIGAEVH